MGPEQMSIQELELVVFPMVQESMLFVITKVNTMTAIIRPCCCANGSRINVLY
jgi:hypothetical protein